MKDRREFLKQAATGAVLMSSGSRLGIAAMLGKNAQAGKSKVVVARDPSLHGTAAQPDEQKVLDSP